MLGMHSFSSITLKPLPKLESQVTQNSGECVHPRPRSITGNAIGLPPVVASKGQS